MKSGWFLVASIIACAGQIPAAGAQEAQQIIVSDGTLVEAIAALSRQTGFSIGTVDPLPTTRVSGFAARLTVEQALDRLLRGSGFIARLVARRVYRLERAPIAKRPKNVEPGPELRSFEPLTDGIIYPEIIVTATKREADSFKLPYSISTTVPDELTGTVGHVAMGTVVAFTNGINKTNMGPGRNRLFIRGVADSAFNGPSQSTVALLLGDARINFDAPDPHLSMVDIARVEVLKGPQGPLYGTGVLGGIYRMVPRAPDPGGAIVQIGSGVGVTSGGASSNASDIVVNLPITNNLAVRAVAYNENIGGWIDDPTSDRNNVNTVSITGARLALQWAPTAWNVTLSGAGQLLRAADSQYATGNAGYTRYTRVAEPHGGDFVALQTTVERSFGDLGLRLTAAYTHHDLNNKFDANYNQNLTRERNAEFYIEERHNSLFSQEIRLSENVGPFQWLIGFNTLFAQSELDWGVGSDPADFDSDELYSKQHRELAFFGDASLEVMPQLTASGGLRIFYSRTKEFEQFDDGARHTDAVGLTPSFSLAWRPNPHAITWLRYSSAQRPGGLNPSADGGSPAFAADKLQSLELGARLRRLNNRLALEANLFALTWSNIQSDVLLRSGLIGTANFGRAHNFGGELLINWRSAVLDGDAGATYQHGDIYAEESVFGRVNDAQLPAIPRFKAHARVAARLLTRGSTSLRVGATVQYTGSTKLSFDPALNRLTDGHAVLGAFIQFDQGRLRWSLNGENLTNSSADTFGLGNPLSVRQEQQRTPVRPRTVMLRVEWRN